MKLPLQGGVPDGSPLTRKRLRWAFMFFDWDGNGKIEQHTVLDALHKLQLPDAQALDQQLHTDALGLRLLTDGMVG